MVWKCHLRSQVKDGPAFLLEIPAGGAFAHGGFLTMNAPGLRTSPVKRGYWVVRQLLGEHIAPPPPNVPDLPSDERLMEASLPEMLARHREVRECAQCHEKFDSIGLSFEGFGPVGELRTLDLADRPIADLATFPDGSEGAGLKGLWPISRRIVRGISSNNWHKNFSLTPWVEHSFHPMSCFSKR